MTGRRRQASQVTTATARAAIEETEEIVKILKSDTLTETDLAYVLHLFHKHNTIEKSFKKAKDLLNEAKAELDRFDDSTAKQSLLTIADYVVTRKK